MNKHFLVFVFLILIGLITVSIYLFVQLDKTINEIQSSTDTGSTLKEMFHKAESELSNDLEVPDMELEDKYSLIVNRPDITVIEANPEEQQFYNDTTITVSSEVIPPYRANLRPRFALKNNPDAIDVSWAELRNFLLEDKTDRNPYVVDVYTCGEFAEDLHNNAEMTGIKAAWVVILWKDSSTPHAINAFTTTDRGMVYIDVNGIREGIARPPNIDSLIKLTAGKSPYAYLLFPDGYTAGQRDTVVSSIEIYW